jgi:hypothetical protein
MVKHMSGIRWPDDWEVRWHCVWSTLCIRRWEACVFWLSLKTKVDGLSVVWPQNHWDGSPSLSLKPDCYDLMICASKSPCRFLGLDLKTKRITSCWLCHKTDGRIKTVWDTRRDLVTCFTWKQVRIGFSSLSSRLVKAQHGWCTWNHRRCLIELKLKTDEPM